MLITWNEVEAIAPEAAAASAPMRVEVLALVTRLINPTAWGTLAPFGARYLAAHLAALGLRKGRGPLTSEKVGELSRTYGNIMGVKGSLGLTAYGAEYQRLCRLLPTYLGAVY